MTKATVSLPSLPALLTAWPGSIDCMAGIHIELDSLKRKCEDPVYSESWIVASHRTAEHTRAINEHTLSLHLHGVSEAHKAGMITLFAVDCWSTAAHLCLCFSVLGPLLPAVGRRRICCLFLKQFFRLCLQPLLRLLRRGHPSPASSQQAGQPCCGRPLRFVWVSTFRDLFIGTLH